MLPFYDCTDFSRINIRITEQPTYAVFEDPIHIIMGMMKVFLHERFARMGKWPVPDIMQKCCSDDQYVLIIRKPELSGSNISKKHSAKRVFKARMVGTRIYKIRKTQLLNVSETLEHGRIEQGKCEILHLNIPMDRVFYYLHEFTKRIFIYNA